MTKRVFISAYTNGTGGVHAYPRPTVEVDANDNEFGRTTGPAYCGFEPDQRESIQYRVWLSDDAFDHLHASVCPECYAILDDGRVADADWQREFRSKYPEVFG